MYQQLFNLLPTVPQSSSPSTSSSSRSETWSRPGPGRSSSSWDTSSPSSTTCPNTGETTLAIDMIFLIWASPGLFWESFLHLSCYIVRLQLINFSMVNDDRKQERVRTIILHIIRKSPTPSKNRMTAIFNCKSLRLSARDLNPACPIRMPSLYHLCHHLFLQASYRPQAKDMS